MTPTIGFFFYFIIIHKNKSIQPMLELIFYKCFSRRIKIAYHNWNLKKN